MLKVFPTQPSGERAGSRTLSHQRICANLDAQQDVDSVRVTSLSFQQMVWDVNQARLPANAK